MVSLAKLCVCHLRSRHLQMHWLTMIDGEGLARLPASRFSSKPHAITQSPRLGTTIQQCPPATKLSSSSINKQTLKWSFFSNEYQNLNQKKIRWSDQEFVKSSRSQIPFIQKSWSSISNPRFSDEFWVYHAADLGMRHWDEVRCWHARHQSWSWDTLHSTPLVIV